MSWRVVRCVLDHHDDKVTAPALLVLIYLANHANGDDGSGAWPSQRRLAAETTLSRRAVQYNLARLLDVGAIEIEQRPGRTHYFRVRMCAVCLPRPSGHQMRTQTNPPAHEVRQGAHEVRRGGAPDAHEPFINPENQPVNAVRTSPATDAAPPARPTGSDQTPAENRKGTPTPSGRQAFIDRRVEQIRQEQGDRAAERYLAAVERNDAKAELKAEIARLASGATPEGYSGYVPAWAAEQWSALHPDTEVEKVNPSPEQETGP